MKVLSVNVGLPRLVEHQGEPLATGIFKEPVKGQVKVNEFNLEGDAQVDLRVHDGYYKAVYIIRLFLSRIGEQFVFKN